MSLQPVVSTQSNDLGAQVLSGVSQVKLSGYLFVYGVHIIIISFPDQLTTFLASSQSSPVSPFSYWGENSLRCCSAKIYRTRNKLFLESAIYLFYFLLC